MYTNRFSITVDAVTAKDIKLTAKTLNMTPTAYIRMCIEGRCRLLQENSNLKARLRDTTIK